MEPIRDPKVIERMETAFDLAEAAAEIMKQNLRRRHPDASEEELRRRFVAWLHHRPGAEHGDGPGRRTDRFKDVYEKQRS